MSSFTDYTLKVRNGADGHGEAFIANQWWTAEQIAALLDQLAGGLHEPAATITIPATNSLAE